MHLPHNLFSTTALFCLRRHSCDVAIFIRVHLVTLGRLGEAIAMFQLDSQWCKDVNLCGEILFDEQICKIVESSVGKLLET